MSKSVGKTDLIDEVARAAKVEKTKAKLVIDKFVDVVQKTLSKGGKIQVTGFGTFSVAKRAKRTGVNPQTKEKIIIAAKKVPKFTAGKTFKDAVK
jgi:DNA-binding protein HU-beta